MLLFGQSLNVVFCLPGKSHLLVAMPCFVCTVMAVYFLDVLSCEFSNIVQSFVDEQTSQTSENQKYYVNLLHECPMIRDKLFVLPDPFTLDNMALLIVHYVIMF